MYKKAGELEVGDIWIDWSGRLWRIVGIERNYASCGEMTVIKHPDGSEHAIMSSKTIEYI